ncbi:hypothetical protein PG985_003554 [Apiospora marii]|uniref:uncharacterized protein n=1 Tax=Apiospora marii TaxID=335849 RepID=UPI00313114F7
MHFSTSLLPIAALLASKAYGAECYAQDGGPRCVTRDEIYNARQDYCGNNLWQQCGSKKYTGINGYRSSIAAVNVPAQKQCYDGINDVIVQCFGKRNGGSFSVGDWNTSGRRPLRGPSTLLVRPHDLHHPLARDRVLPERGPVPIRHRERSLLANLLVRIAGYVREKRMGLVERGIAPPSALLPDLLAQLPLPPPPPLLYLFPIHRPPLRGNTLRDPPPLLQLDRLALPIPPAVRPAAEGLAVDELDPAQRPRRPRPLGDEEGEVGGHDAVLQPQLAEAPGVAAAVRGDGTAGGVDQPVLLRVVTGRPKSAAHRAAGVRRQHQPAQRRRVAVQVAVEVVGQVAQKRRVARARHGAAVRVPPHAELERLEAAQEVRPGRPPGPWARFDGRQVPGHKTTDVGVLGQRLPHGGQAGAPPLVRLGVRQVKVDCIAPVVEFEVPCLLPCVVKLVARLDSVGVGSRREPDGDGYYGGQGLARQQLALHPELSNRQSTPLSRTSIPHDSKNQLGISGMPPAPIPQASSQCRYANNRVLLDPRRQVVCPNPPVRLYDIHQLLARRRVFSRIGAVQGDVIPVEPPLGHLAAPDIRKNELGLVEDIAVAFVGM